MVFLILGSYADFGTFRPNILIAISLVAWGIGFGWLGVHHQEQWKTGLGLYIVGLIAYQLCLTYWTAAFPGLARNTTEMREKAMEYERGEVTREEYDFSDMMKRNQLQNVAFIVQSLGEIVILAVIVGIMFGVNVNASEANNNWGLVILIAFASGVWLLLALPWFWLEKRRPGQDPGKQNARKRYHLETCAYRLQKSHRHEYRPSRLLATLPRLFASLAIETIPGIPHRLFPTGRQSQHHRHCDCNSPEFSRGVQYA